MMSSSDNLPVPSSDGTGSSTSRPSKNAYKAVAAIADRLQTGIDGTERLGQSMDNSLMKVLLNANDGEQFQSVEEHTLIEGAKAHGFATPEMSRQGTTRFGMDPTMPIRMRADKGAEWYARERIERLHDVGLVRIEETRSADGDPVRTITFTGGEVPSWHLTQLRRERRDTFIRLSERMGQLRAKYEQQRATEHTEAHRARTAFLMSLTKGFRTGTAVLVDRDGNIIDGRLRASIAEEQGYEIPRKTIEGDPNRAWFIQVVMDGHDHKKYSLRSIEAALRNAAITEGINDQDLADWLNTEQDDDFLDLVSLPVIAQPRTPETVVPDVSTPDVTVDSPTAPVPTTMEQTSSTTVTPTQPIKMKLEEYIPIALHLFTEKLPRGASPRADFYECLHDYLKPLNKWRDQTSKDNSNSALKRLLAAGFLKKDSRGWYGLTDLGREVYAIFGDRVGNVVLWQFITYQHTEAHVSENNTDYRVSKDIKNGSRQKELAAEVRRRFPDLTRDSTPTKVDHRG